MNAMINPPRIHGPYYMAFETALQKCGAVFRALCVLACLCFWQACPAPAFAEGEEYGDSFITGTLSDPSNLIPALSSDASSSEVSANFYVSLIKYDKNLVIVPYAAESFEVLDEGLRLRFVLRKGILWQDGTELTADDVEFTYKMMIDPATPTAYASDFKAVKEFRKLDRYTLEVVYDKPFARSLTTWMSSIMPRHALQGQDLRTTAFARNPLSAGPYTLFEWKPGARVNLRANPSYFDGKPYIDQIVYRVIPDLTTMFLELKAGKLDSLGSLTPQQYRFQTNTPEFRKEFTIFPSPSFSYTYLGYNLKSPLFSDKRVRQALAHAINKEDIIKGALLGLGDPTIGPYQPGTWVYNTHIQPYTHSLEQAKALLAQAGWQQGQDGVLRNAKGEPFSFTLLVNQGNEIRIKTAVILQSQLKALGIDVNIRTVEWAAFLQQFVNPGFFDAVILAWTIPLDPDGYDVWHSTRAGGGLNFISFKNEEADKLLEEGRTTFDRDKRKRVYDRFQEVLHEEQPYCFLYVPHRLTVIQNRFKGLETAPGGIFHNFTKWWVPGGDQRHRVQAQ